MLRLPYFNKAYSLHIPLAPLLLLFPRLYSPDKGIAELFFKYIFPYISDFYYSFKEHFNKDNNLIIITP